MKIPPFFLIYCLIFHFVSFIASSNNEQNIGFEVVNNESSYSLDTWLAAITEIWDQYDRKDNSSSYHDSGIRNEAQNQDRISDHERMMAHESRFEDSEKSDHLRTYSLHDLQSGPQVRKRIAQPGITLRSDALFDSRTSLSDWSITDFCDAIIAHNETRYQDFKESKLWFSGKGRKTFIKRKFVEHVVRRYPLYKNPHFIEVIKTLPFVRESIAHLELDIRQGNFCFAPDDHAVESIRTLHRQFEKEKRYKQERTILQRHNPEVIAKQNRPSTTNPLYHIVDPKMQQVWDERHAAYEQTKNNPATRVQEYALSIETHNYLLNHGINLGQQHYYCGNALQQHFHKEYLSIAHAFAAIDACGKGTEMMLDLMFKLIKEASEHHYYKIAALASDYCNQALLIAEKHLQAFYEHCPKFLRYAANAVYEMIKKDAVDMAQLVAAVGLGVYDGFKNVGRMALHPIQTVQYMALGIAHLGFILVRHLALMEELADLHEYWEDDSVKRAKIDERERQIRTLLDDDWKAFFKIVKDSGKELSTFGGIRKGVAFATECIILHKVQTRCVSIVKETGIVGKISAKMRSASQNIKFALSSQESARVAVALEGATALLETGGMTAQELALLNEVIDAAKAAKAVASGAANAGNVAKIATAPGEMTEVAAKAVAEEVAEFAAVIDKKIVSEAVTTAEKATEKIARVIRTVEDILEECVTMPQDRPYYFTKQYQKSGSYQKVIQDFESLCPKDVKSFTPSQRCKTSGMHGVLEDGRTITVRDISSKEGWPTLEIQNLDKTKTKIRYITETQI